MQKKDLITKRRNFNKRLGEITSDCPQLYDASKLAMYNKRSLSKLVENYNECELKPFPHFRFGVSVAYQLSKLGISTKQEAPLLDQLDFEYDRAFMFGLFADQPLFMSAFSIRPEMYYSKQGFSYTKRATDEDIDFVSNVSSLIVPVLIRFSYPSNNIRPFVNVGSTFAYNFKKEYSLFQTVIGDDIIQTNLEKEESILAEQQIGYSVGAVL